MAGMVEKQGWQHHTEALADHSRSMMWEHEHPKYMNTLHILAMYIIYQQE
jgi:hypothetical protein